MPEDTHNLDLTQIHLSKLTVAQLIGLQQPLEVIYHRSTIPIAYVLPAIPIVQRLIANAFPESSKEIL